MSALKGDGVSKGIWYVMLRLRLLRRRVEQVWNRRATCLAEGDSGGAWHVEHAAPRYGGGVDD